MSLLENILEHMDIVAMTGSLHLPNIAFGGSFEDLACAFYDLNGDSKAVNTENTEDNPESSGSSSTQNGLSPGFASAVPLVSSIEQLSELSTVCLSLDTQGVAYKSEETHLSHQTFTQSISLMLKIVSALDASSSLLHQDFIPLTITWDAEDWFTRISKPLGSKVNSNRLLRPPILNETS